MTRNTKKKVSNVLIESFRFYNEYEYEIYSWFWHFSINKRAQMPAIRITEQPIMLTKGKINCPGYKFLSILAKSGQSNLVLVLVLVLEPKGP